MKKAVIFLLALCLLLFCPGCKRQSAEPTAVTDSTQSSSLPTVPGATEIPEITVPVSSTQMPMLALSVPACTQTETAGDGAVIFQYLYQNVNLTCEDPVVADQILLDLMNRIDATQATAKSILALAQENYTGGSFSPYLCRMTYEPKRIDRQVLSLFGSYIQYTGSPHPEHTYPSVSYDMATGKVLTLPGILAVDNAGDTLCQFLLDALAPMAEEKSLYPGYVATVTERFSGDLSQKVNWYFTPTGLCFYFLPYEIAPYTSGVITAEIPYSQLPGVIGDAYFPPEREEVPGTVQVMAFDVDALEQFSQFPEVTLESGKDQVLLYAEGSVYHVRLEVGGPSYGGAYAADYTAFASYSLTPGDALLVEADIPVDAARLRLTFTSGTEQHQMLLRKDAQGHYTLTEEN